MEVLLAEVADEDARPPHGQLSLLTHWQSSALGVEATQFKPWQSDACGAHQFLAGALAVAGDEPALGHAPKDRHKRVWKLGLRGLHQ